MALYPTSVAIDDAQITKLTATYEQAYVAIYNEIATSTVLGQVRRKQILTQVEVILKELGVDTDAFIKENVPTYYKLGADLAVKQMQAINYSVDIKTGFNIVHRSVIQELVSDTASAFGESMSGVNRSVRALMSSATKEALTQQMATGSVSGSAARQIKKNLMATIQEQGLDALTDKSGRKWSLDRYTEMLLRTKLTEARNTGLKNRLVENGIDLVVVSQHGATDVCGDWEGKILSLTGATTELDGESIPTVAEAEADGLFHPNCKHAINALSINIAKETMAWNPDTKEYEQGLID